MHALIHIRTVIIPRDRYRPKWFSPRVDIGRGMITVLVWKKDYSIYRIFHHWNKNNKVNFPYSHQTCIDMGDQYRLRDDNSPAMEKVMHWSIHRKAWYRVIRFLSRYLAHGLISLWHFRCLRIGKIDVITYTYVIKTIYTQTMISCVMSCISRFV